MASPTPPRSPEPAKTRVLVIDDDRELCGLIQDYLEPFGYEVAAEHHGPDGAERAVSGDYQAVILDLMLPGLDGFEVLRRIRGKSDVPVLMLTARGEETDRIVGLEMGADDYLPKTFSSRELLARLRAVTRRTAAATASATHPGALGGGTGKTRAPAPDIVAGDLRINPETRVAVLGERPLQLTALEFDILAELARARGRVKTREQLVETIAERDFDGLGRSVDVHIWSLRKKLGDDPKAPRYIETVRAVGYRFINPLASAG